MQGLELYEEKIERDQFRGEIIKNSKFLNCDFSSSDLRDTQFIDC
ncbi:conserved hypothetical protein [Xenorhabdus bovienii str. Jollieti]|nr:conserved hypothetical protein [Xenorhabdus bovienii SS-2004]CDH28175.1 conserved hypothetical protein [Xenorhabdus bovienii str. Jollieti]